MLKFFRKYNKYILAFGVTGLMVIFLIEGALPMAGGNRGDLGEEVIGTLDGEELTLNDQRFAGNDLVILGQLSPLLAPSERESDAALRWLLMVRHAESMGLSASEFETDQVLMEFGLEDAAKLSQAAKRMGTSNLQVRDAIKRWLIVEQYKELVLGRAHLDPGSRLAILNRAGQMYLQVQQAAQQNPQFAAMLLNYVWSMRETAMGLQRVSEPVVQRFLYDHGAQASVTVVPLPAEKRLTEVGTPDEAVLRALFDKHRDKLAGAGAAAAKAAAGGPAPASRPADEADYGFGYRSPERVKLDYLAISPQQAEAKVEIDEAEALSFYEDNRAQFRNPPPPGTQPASQTQPLYRSYEGARPEIISLLRARKADELAGRIVKAAQALMAAEYRSKPEVEGYRKLDADWSPQPFPQVARQLQEQFGVLPQAVRIEDRWLERKDLEALPGIGLTGLRIGAGGGSFADYALSARELNPTADNPLTAQRLQVGVPSQPLTNPTDPTDGTRYLFRIIAAEPARTPESLEEVREQVVRDARRLEAYKRLVAEAPALLEEFRRAGPEAFARERGVSVLTPPKFSRREMNPMVGALGVPDVQGVGRSEAFVDGVFDLVSEVTAAGGVEAVAPAKRSAAVPVDPKLMIYLVRLDKLDTITREEYEQQLRSSGVSAWLQQTVAERLSQDPFSLDAIIKRAGFKPAHEPATPTEGGAATQPAA